MMSLWIIQNMSKLSWNWLTVPKSDLAVIFNIYESYYISDDWIRSSESLVVLGFFEKSIIAWSVLIQFPL